MQRPNVKPYLATLLVTLALLGLGAAIVSRDEGPAPPVTSAANFARRPAAALPAAFVAPPPSDSRTAKADPMAGIASWYGEHWQGRKTASGTRFDMRKLTAAHRSLPLNTRVRVTNIENGRSVVVLINDRGPYVDGRVIDLSTAAARRLGMIREGVVPVEIEVVARANTET